VQLLFFFLSDIQQSRLLAWHC